MKNEILDFKVNGVKQLRGTMQEAINYCRNRAIGEKKNSALSVRVPGTDKFILLAEYEPSDRNPILAKILNESNLEYETVPVPCCDVTLRTSPVEYITL